MPTMDEHDGYLSDDSFRKYPKGPMDCRIRPRKIDPRAVYTEFRGPAAIFKSAGAGAATGTAGDVNILVIDGVTFEYHVKGTQTILVPTQTTSGLNIAQDLTANDGIEYTNGIVGRGKTAFTVGTDGAFYAKCKFLLTDVSGTDDCAFGFRKAEAYQANVDDYDEMAALNVIAGDIKIETILNNGATTTTDTTDNWADTETHTLEVLVSAAGVVTYKIDGKAPTTTAAFTFDNGEVVVPFFFFLHDTDVAETTCLVAWEVGLQGNAPAAAMNL